MPDSPNPVLRFALSWSFKILATAVVVAIPVLGVWVGSSMAAYANGPIWVSAVAGLAVFPLVPLLWDFLAEKRRRKKDKEREEKKARPRPRILGWWDRLIVRTLVLSLTLLIVLFSLWPATIFTALSTRGDWMLDGRQDSASQPIRDALLSTADSLAFLYEATECRRGVQEFPSND